jgi:tetratricopeptide (TPR) repeat protein
VYAYSIGYARRGPYGHKPAFNDLVQGVSGAASLQSRVDGLPPRFLPSLIADKTTGLHLAIAVLGALYQRQRTGEGQLIEVPMFETMAAFWLTEHLFGATWQPPRGDMGYDRIINSFRHLFATRDGYIFALPYTDQHGITFFEPIPENMGRALSLADTLDDALWRSRITAALAHYFWLVRDLPRAFDLARRAIDIAECTGEALTAALARGNLGRVHWARGEYAAAVALFRECLKIDPTDVPRGVAAIPAIPSVVAILYAYTGRQAEARAIVDASRQSRDRSALSKIRLSEAALAAGALPQARECAELALALSREQMGGGDEAWSLYLLGAINAREEPASMSISEDHYRHGLLRAEELGMRPVVAHCHLGLRKLYHRTGQREQGSGLGAGRAQLAHGGQHGDGHHVPPGHLRGPAIDLHHEPLLRP